MVFSRKWKIVLMAVGIVIVATLGFGIYGVNAVGGVSGHVGKPFTPRSSR